ncbi:class I SAM-dependent rRNA methyltransferase [Methylocaldum szegediense]|uniref:23S rRNA (Cytosine1962-C5)-methyltransferase n=1 Tax=Methylocaldum szegediense TaxID=73780 RepID=A0ABM9HZ10_9GAMM|nr:class I SAM-dependent rRNA methyltransferase [Methylocaldum szegediense]CAI8779745.1 23S rRNA (cytosine1962-C5)-methyltransferase [Methylocaldum szegediense]
MSQLPSIRLKKNEERRLRGGHLWIFSNEVDIEAMPLKSFGAGDLAIVESSRGQVLGIAYVNPASLICGRLLTRDAHAAIDRAFFERRLTRALRLRERLFSRPFYRLTYGESDGLPGVVIDRFDDVFVVQTNTAGMERLQEPLVAAIEALFAPRAIVAKNTSSLRALEGLDTYTSILRGTLDGPIQIEENGARFLVDPISGQKTGWFFDHRESRAVVAKLSRGLRVLDLFSYTGAWGVQAALAGAASVECVDGSEAALALAAENGRLNGVLEKMRLIKDDAFEFLKRAREERQRYDLVVLDPPALIKRKKDVGQGIEAYRRLNQAAIQVLAPGGILVSASCSFHLRWETLHDLLRAVARALDRHVVFFGRGGQAADHPVHPAIPETDYLKTFFCYIGESL